MEGVDIGGLAGHIALDDEVSSALDLAVHKLEQFGAKFEGIFGGAITAAAAAVTAIGFVGGAIAALATKGSEVNDVTEGFEKLAGGVENAHKVMEALHAGTLGTIDDLQLMTFANKAMATGALTTAKEFGTLSTAAKILSDRFGGDLTDSMNSIQRAMVTGQTRGLAMQGVVVDLQVAESTYASTLNKTTDALTDQEKLTAKRQAIMEALNKVVADAGPLQADFGEKMEAAGVAIQNWGIKLASAIAASPNVIAAFDSISKAISEAFGGSGQTILDTIVSWVNKFADAVTEYGPPIIRWLRDVVDRIKATWEQVKAAWDAVPDWFKRIAEQAALAGVAVYATKTAMEGLSGPDTVNMLGSLATIWSQVGSSIVKAAGFMKEWAAIMVAFKWEGILLALRTFAGFIAASATGTATLVVGIGYALAGWQFGFSQLNDTWSQILAKAKEWVGLSHKPPTGDVNLPWEGPKVETTESFRLATPKDLVSPELQAAIANLKKNQADLVLSAQAYAAFMGGNWMTHPIEQQKAYYNALDAVVKNFGSLKKAGLDSLTGIYTALAASHGALGALAQDTQEIRDKGFKETTQQQEQLALEWASAYGKAYLAIRQDQQTWAVDWERKTSTAFQFQYQEVARWLESEKKRYATSLGFGQAYSTAVVALTAEASHRVQEINQEMAQSQALKDWNAYVAANGHAPGVKGATTDAPKETVSFKDGLDKVSDAFKTLATVAGDSMDKVGRSIATGIVSINQFYQGMSQGLPGFMSILTIMYQGFQKLSGLIESTAHKQARLAIENFGKPVPVTDLEKMEAERDRIQQGLIANPALPTSKLTAGLEVLKALQARIDELKASADKVPDALKRLGLSADDLKTPVQLASEAAIQLGKDLEAIGRNKNVDEIAKKLAGPLNDALRNAVETGVKLDPSMRPYLESLAKAGLLQEDLARKILGLPAPDTTPWEEMKRVGEEFGLTEDQLGEKFRNAKLVSGAEELAKNWNLLVGNGADVGAVMDKMKEQANGFLNNAKKWGLEVPESMKPMLQAMLDAGELTDENGRKLDSLDDVNWGRSIQSAIGDLISKLGEFFDKLRDPPTMVIHTDYALPTGYVPGTFGPGAGMGTPGTGVPVPVPVPPGSTGVHTGVGGSTHVNSFTIQTLDSASMDSWLRSGGARKIAEAVVNVSKTA